MPTPRPRGLGTTWGCWKWAHAGRPRRPLAFGRVVELDPTHADGWRGLGAALAADDTARGRSAWQRVIELDPHDFDTLYNLGMMLAESGRRAEALPYLRRFLAEAPRDRYAQDLPRVRALLARAGEPVVKMRVAAAAAPRRRRRRRWWYSPASSRPDRICRPARCAATTCCSSPSTRCASIASAPTATPAGLTPTIDRLATRACDSTSVRAHAPLTLPSHASLMTGRIPPRHGVRDNGTYRLDPAQPTLAAALKSGGYQTGAFVGAFVLDARFGLARGFDRLR